MYLCHVELVVGSFGSFLCSVSANWRVALRVFNVVWSCSGELVLISFGSCASVAVVGWMWYVVVPLGVRVLVSIECQSVTPVSHSGAMCLRSLLEKWMGLHCCIISVSYALVPMMQWMVCRF